MQVHGKPPYMFASPTIDYFFRWRWWAAWLVFLPIGGAALFLAVQFAVNLFLVATFVGVGILFWTFFEYVMHRFCFHFVGKSQRLQHMHYVVHGMHHEYPTDPLRVIFPPFASAIVGALIAGIFLVLLPLSLAFATTTGFVIGYVFYEFMHWAAHHVKWKHPWFYQRKRQHLLHHHNDQFREKNFGVTTSLWDKVFQTYLPTK